MAVISKQIFYSLALLFLRESAGLGGANKTNKICKLLFIKPTKAVFVEFMLKKKRRDLYVPKLSLQLI